MNNLEKILEFDHEKRIKLLAESPEIYFRTLARRYRLIGAKLAEKMFLFGDKAECYAASFLAKSLKFKDLSEALALCEADLTAADIPFQTEELLEIFTTLTEEAENQVRKEPPDTPTPSR